MRESSVELVERYRPVVGMLRDGHFSDGTPLTRETVAARQGAMEHLSPIAALTPSPAGRWLMLAGGIWAPAAVVVAVALLLVALLSLAFLTVLSP